LAVRVASSRQKLRSFTRNDVHFYYRKSEKSASIVRDDSFTNIANYSDALSAKKRLASAPPENNPTTSSSASQRRSRFDNNNTNSSHEHLPSLISSPDDSLISDVMSSSATAAGNSAMGTSKNRFFSLSRRFRFRVQSPDKSTAPPPTAAATVHFLDEDIDLETKERTARKSDQSGNRPSKGILKTLRHRSPFRFRSKDAVIPEQDSSPPPPEPVPTPQMPPVQPPPPPPVSSAPKDTKKKPPPAAPTTTIQPKPRGRLVELKKAAPKSSPSNGAPRKETTTAPNTEPSGSSLVRKTSGLKDLIHKFDVSTDKTSKSKRTGSDGGGAASVPISAESKQDEQVLPTINIVDTSSDEPLRPPVVSSTEKSKAIDIPDLLRNVEKDPSLTTSKAILRHSNSSRQTMSFDSMTSMVSASESIITTNSSSMRKPTSTARPLMISLVSDVLG
jgi:hypothetical protein